MRGLHGSPAARGCCRAATRCCVRRTRRGLCCAGTAARRAARRWSGTRRGPSIPPTPPPDSMFAREFEWLHANLKSNGCTRNRMVAREIEWLRANSNAGLQAFELANRSHRTGYDGKQSATGRLREAPPPAQPSSPSPQDAPSKAPTTTLHPCFSHAIVLNSIQWLQQPLSRAHLSWTAAWSPMVRRAISAPRAP